MGLLFHRKKTVSLERIRSDAETFNILRNLLANVVFNFSINVLREGSFVIIGFQEDDFVLVLVGDEVEVGGQEG